jgi:hypothetical protein
MENLRGGVSGIVAIQVRDVNLPTRKATVPQHAREKHHFNRLIECSTYSCQGGLSLCIGCVHQHLQVALGLGSGHVVVHTAVTLCHGPLRVRFGVQVRARGEQGDRVRPGRPLRDGVGQGVFPCGQASGIPCPPERGL